MYKVRNFNYLTLILYSLFIFTSCITPKEKRLIRSDLYDAQSRLLQLENSLKKNEYESKKKGATASTTIDKVNHKLNKLLGEIDNLKVGVQAGQLPSANIEDQQNSVAALIRDLQEQVKIISAKQSELFSIIKSAKKSPTKKKQKFSDFKNLDELNKAYNNSYLTKITKKARQLIKTLKHSDKIKAQEILANSYFELKKYPDAALEYNNLIELKPKQSVKLRAKFKLGNSFKALGDTNTAKMYYEEIVISSPNSSIAKKASKEISTLK